MSRERNYDGACFCGPFGVHGGGAPVAASATLQAAFDCISRRKNNEPSRSAPGLLPARYITPNHIPSSLRKTFK